MKYAVTAVLLGLMAAPAQADFLGIYAGAGTFKGGSSGTLGQDGIDVERDLGLSDDDSGFQGYIAFEHPVPLLPNIKVAAFSYDTDGRGELTQEFEFGGMLIPAGSQTNTVLDYQHTDITLYYELWDTGFDLDLGLTARQLDVTSEVAYNVGIMDTSSGVATERFDEWLPMIYGAARVDLPLTGLYLAGEVNGTGYSGSSFIDYQVKLGWTFSLVALELGLEAGYRSLMLDLDEDDVGDLTTDIDIDGAFLNAVLHF
ncbi:TIGR04219 family outer membrane beta-barrel protein [Ferrimonas balearica]|uniref:TIGR04219 family outer membrane beta-barrel protein n=1 Tax=Ferrimonas balearica TaxID=44012 RepID=UPI001C99F755|nr:TIGR04219 family outer membrane beta-barrel protein [Ferrimonas balearica]MBY5992969.1 TIGR04219 family outer membrane beta-barrel protein [Ferrimonas balearica]